MGMGPQPCAHSSAGLCVGGKPEFVKGLGIVSQQERVKEQDVLRWEVQTRRVSEWSHCGVRRAVVGKWDLTFAVRPHGGGWELRRSECGPTPGGTAVSNPSWKQVAPRQSGLSPAGVFFPLPGATWHCWAAR